MASAYPSPAPSPTLPEMASGPSAHARPRVAVVGSGLAGLTTAYLLRKEGADVWLIEKATQLGFHAWSVELEKSGKLATSVTAGEAATWKEETGYTVPNAASKPSALLPSPLNLSPRRRTSRTSSSSSSKGHSTQLSPGLGGPSIPSTLSPDLSTSESGAKGLNRKPSITLRPDTVAVDVPMRSFQGGYYPLLIALYSHLKLPIAPAYFSFSFSTLRPRRKKTTKEDTYFIHSGASGVSLPSVPANAWRNPIALVKAVWELFIAAICYIGIIIVSLLSWHNLLPKPLSGDASFLTVVDSVATFLDKPVARLPRTRLGPHFRAFAADVVLPLFSAVGTMTADDVWSTPAVHILDYIHAGVGTAHYSLGGNRSARDVARLLAAPIRKQGQDRLRLGSSIRSIKYSPKNGRPGVTLQLDGGSDIEVDCVVIATPARAARHLLGTFEPTLAVHGEKAEARRVARMRTALADVAYRETIVTTHRDKIVLPPAADVRDINLVQPIVVDPYFTDPAARSPPLNPTALHEIDLGHATPLTPSPSSSFPVHQLGDSPFFPPTPQAIYTMATHVIKPTKDLAPVYQTTNPVIPIDPETVLGVARLERALPLRDGRTLAGLHPPTTPGATPLVYLVGSYAYPGIPLLEGCVGSARRVAEQLLALPQQAAVGGVDWDTGRGGLLGRLWRWRLVGRGGY